jgi:hypothetical protein
VKGVTFDRGGDAFVNRLSRMRSRDFYLDRVSVHVGEQPRGVKGEDGGVGGMSEGERKGPGGNGLG